MFHSRISVIGGHNKNDHTDHLYDPLRKTFLLDTTARKTYIEDASRVSHITHLTSMHNYNQNHQLGERTLIDQDRKLVRKLHVINYPDKSRYRIINAEQRQLSPISADQFERRIQLSRKRDEEVIVYTYGDEQIEQEQIIDEEVENYEKFEGPVRRKFSGIKVTQPKYNLFSMIDEPINNLISGKSCTCPANQVVAQDKNQISWDLNPEV